MKRVSISCLPYTARHCGPETAVIAVDVIRATTTIVTALSQHRRCFAAHTESAARALASQVPGAILAGEQKGVVPPGFEMNNSPAEIARRPDRRPVIVLSSSGTVLLHEARHAAAVYVACFRNAAAIAAHAAERHDRVCVIGAGSNNEFREEDQICCAWIVRDLMHRGFAVGSPITLEIVQHWGEATASDCGASHSVDYLRRSRQLQDLRFILSHVNDLKDVCIMQGDEALLLPATSGQSSALGEREVA